MQHNRGRRGPFTAHFNSVPYKALVWGPMGEASKDVFQVINGVAHLAARRACFGLGRGKTSVTLEAQGARLARQLRRDLSLVAARGRAQLLLARRAHVYGAPPVSHSSASDESGLQVRAALVAAEMGERHLLRTGEDPEAALCGEGAAQLLFNAPS